MKLNDKLIQATLKAGKPTRLADGTGLTLLIAKTGRAYWQWRLKGPTGKFTTISYGTYPLVTLAQARDAHTDAKRGYKTGIHPAQARRQARAHAAEIAANTWGDVCNAWLKVMASKWSSSHLKTVEYRIKHDLAGLRRRPLTEITAPELLKLLQTIETRGALESTKRIRIIIGQVFRYAMALGKVDRDPSAALVDVLKTAPEAHHAAITDPTKLALLLRSIRSYSGSEIVRKALQLHVLTFQRPGEIRGMRWTELDLDAGIWTIPSARMKSTVKKKETGEPHLVPLSSQAVKLLRDLQPITGHHELVFPGQRGQGSSLSEAACLTALRNLGYRDQHTPHGFRATARTLLDERLGWRPEIIEAQLAHTVRDPLGRAYNRTQFIDQRKDMMQRWGDYLDELTEARPVTLPEPATPAQPALVMPLRLAA